MPDTNENEKNKAIKYDKRSKWGFRAIVCGFFLQFTSNILGCNNILSSTKNENRKNYSTANPNPIR